MGKKRLEWLMKAVNTALNSPVIAYRDKIPYPDGAQYQVCQFLDATLRGVPENVRGDVQADGSVPRFVETDYSATYAVEYIGGNAMDRHNKFNSWLRSNEARVHFSQRGMMFVRLNTLLDLSLLEGATFTERYRAELLFAVNVKEKITDGVNPDEFCIVHPDGRKQAIDA